MELGFLFAFSLTLIGCVATGIPILYALGAGYLLFFTYALLKGRSVRAVLQMSLDGVRTAKNVLFTFVLIGLLTASWRAAGTIPAAVFYAAELIRPPVFLPMAFLLNCAVSFLTGTSFGTSATMGVICMTMGRAMGVSPVWAGGAILSGAFFGDRCSPVSSSALLVSELTATNIFENIRAMLKTGLVPFLLTCAVYTAAGLASPAGAAGAADAGEVFAASFRLGPVTLLPALAILVLSLRRVNIRLTLLAGIASAMAVCLLYQGTELLPLLRLMLLGYHAPDPRAAGMLDGGGIVSMLGVAAIVCISSSYAGIFRETGLLDGLKSRVAAFGQRRSPYGAVLLASLLAATVACNQTLAILLAHQLCASAREDRAGLAVDLENTAVVIAPLIPWSIAGSVPLASVSAPTASLAAACYLYLLPLWNLAVRARRGGGNSARG